MKEMMRLGGTGKGGGPNVALNFFIFTYFMFQFTAIKVLVSPENAENARGGTPSGLGHSLESK
jgi:hypothetical protein